MSFETNASSRPSSDWPHLPIMQSVRGRKHGLSNIWIFHSPKNDRRFIIKGDVRFMHFVLLEGDPTIVRYDVDPPPVVATVGQGNVTLEFDASVYFADGKTEYRDFRRSKTEVSNSHLKPAHLASRDQEKAGVRLPYRLFTENDLQDKTVLFDNWLLLCAAMTRARNQSLFREAGILRSRLNSHHTVTMDSLLAEPASDPGLMLAVVAKSLQDGIIQTELTRRIFGMDSLISWGQI